MKKIIILFALLFTGTILAQTSAGYWTESTAGQNTKLGLKGYTAGITTAKGAADTAQYIYTQPFGLTSATGSVRNGFMGKKILVGINVTVAFSNVNATLVSQISYDGTNWYDLATLSSDTNPQITGVTMYLADFTTVYAPYARMKFNASGLTVNKTGRIIFFYCDPN
jgi:hypothetical protein